MSLKLASALALISVVCGAPASAQNTIPLNALIDRASAYVHGYVQDFASVVAEECYAQDSHPMARADGFGSFGTQGASEHVDLKSDLLFVRPDSADKWLTFRDVFSVNGRAVRDREARLATLFVDQSPSAIDRALEITREGYRYNVGARNRTVANPLLALAFLQPEYRQRFDFRLSGIDTARGPDVWILKFKERVRPTVLRNQDGRNVVAGGRFWIDGASGRVLQTELETSVGDRVMTLFGFDEHLQLDVPLEMRDIAWHNGIVVTGVATYANFRRFGVATGEEFR